MSMAYGIQIKDTNDPFINLAEAAVKSASEASVPGAFLVDVIPILKHVPEFVPGAGFKKQARIWRKLQEDLRERPYVAAIDAMVLYRCIFHFNFANFSQTSGRARPSFTSMALGNLDETRNANHQQEVIQDTAAMVFAGTSLRYRY
jgi:hypothetical protein